MKVIKIGGTALSNSKGLNKFCSSLKTLTTPTIVVVSALDKLSSTLKKHYYSTSYPDNFTPFISTFTDFRHLLCQKQLIIFDEYTLQCQKKLTDIIKGCQLTNEFSEKALDKILVLGELLSSFFIFCLLKSNNIESKYLDIRGTIVTDSKFGNASPDIEISNKNISNLSFPTLTITQGFIAADKNKDDTTMGFESSNLSALLIAQAVNCQTIEIYTKVNHIYSLDPELYNAQPVHQIPFQSAQILANTNFKLLFPGMIELAMKRNIEIVYKGLDTDKRTIVSSSSDFTFPVIYLNGDQLIVTPIRRNLALGLINEYTDQFIDFEYKSNDYSLIAWVDKIDLEKLQNSITLLLKKH